MNMTHIWTVVVGMMLVGAGQAPGQQPPSYARQIKPFFARYCLECHNADKLKGELNLETYKSLQAGGKKGPEIVPGKPDQSRMVLMVEGKAKRMPPKKARQPRPDEIKLVRAWVASGAKDDVATLTIKVPDIKPRVPAVAPVAALAYHPNGKVLAAGRYKEVALIDVATGDVSGTLGGQSGATTALAFSPDGRWLVVASGSAGQAGDVRLYAVSADGTPAPRPVHVLPAHKDLILAVAFSPDSKTLATCGYDRLIKLWTVAAGKEARTLKDHSDSVYAVAFSPDGRLLASGAADRAVKVWDVASGTRLYTLAESTDWVYAVAWSPDGRHLAAAGVDKSIRVWHATASGGRVVQSVFAHEGPVNRLVYSADGKTLYSVSEDRTAKAWETGKMVERKVYDRQPENVLAVALRPDQKQLSFGRYDGAVLLLDPASGAVQAEPLPVKPKPPQLTRITPTWGQRGRAVRVVLEGKYLDQPAEIIANHPGVSAGLLAGGKTARSLRADLTFPAQTPAGVYELRLKTVAGTSSPVSFTVDPFAQVAEKEPNDSPSTGQKVTLPATVVGAVSRAGDIDFYRFEAKAGQQIGVQVLTSAVGSKLEPVLELADASGRTLVETASGVLGYTCPRAGTYAVGIRDRDYRGAGDMHYRLHVGGLPVVTAVFPLGLQRGTQAEIHVEGVNLVTVKSLQGQAGDGTDKVGGDAVADALGQSIRVKAPASAPPGSRLPVPVTTPQGPALGGPSVVVGEFAEVTAAQGKDSGAIPVPGTANGRIRQPGATDTWTFTAKKGQRVVIEVNARRLGSPLDSSIEVLDAKGRPVPRAVLRCLSQTYTTFRDHDSRGPGIRLESWSELAVNDYLLVGNELVRIRQLPKNPDDDCEFFSVGGQRQGYLGTTPAYHSLGTPMYKVAIHPPGTTFAPNGLPVVTIYYRNDDGGAGYGKDSRLFFDPPADGEYQVRVGDARGQGGSNYGYRLTVRPPRPGFNVSFKPTSPSVWKGGAIPVHVTAERIDGFEGAIDIRPENLPAGFSAPATSIPAEEYNTVFALYADPKAVTPTKGKPLKLVARATIADKEVVRGVTGGLPKAVEPGDIVTTTDQSEVSVRPGGQVVVRARIERRHGFAGRVPLDVRGLPHGVQVLDIGLNGILITEKDTSRTFVIYAEPWVKPMSHPFVVLAKHEAQGTEHAARSVLLKVEK